MKQRGVTLVELIVVMVIIAIGAVLIAPNIGGFLPNYRLRSGAREIVSTMRLAQMKAISTNQGHGVAFGANSFQVFYRDTGGVLQADGVSVSLPKGVELIDNTFPLVTVGGSNKPFAEFNPNSTSSAGAVNVKGKKGSKRITVASATGRIKIE